MRKSLLIMMLAIVCLASTGCGSDKALTKTAMEHMSNDKGGQRAANVRFRLSSTFALSDQTLDSRIFPARVEVADVNVSCQSGLVSQGQYFAEQMSDLLDYVRSETGVDIFYHTDAYLLRVDRVPAECQMQLKAQPKCFPLPLFVAAGEESTDAIIAANAAYPNVYVHELTEMSLIFHDPPGVVLPDVGASVLVFNAQLKNYTRWFRDGMANYAGHIAQNHVASQMDSGAEGKPGPAFQNPFSSLAKVGGDLFKWHQYSPDSLNSDYYSAALGLFLVVRDRFGPESIRQIVRDVYKSDYLDGDDLIEICNRVLGTDIVELAEDFRLPQLGVTYIRLTQVEMLNNDLDASSGLLVTAVDANSPAEKADIRVRDVIVKLGDAPIDSGFDLQYALFRLIDADSAPIAIRRKGEDELTLEVEFGD